MILHYACFMKGIVTTQEIGFVLRNLGLFPTEQELQQMLKEIDIDGNI